MSDDTANNTQDDFDQFLNTGPAASLDPDAAPAASPKPAGGVSDFNFPTMDLSEVDPDAGFQPLPVGWYTCAVLRLEAKNAKSSGAPMAVWVFEVMDVEYAKRQLFYNCVLTNDRGLQSFVKAIHLTTPDYPLDNFQITDYINSGQALGQRLMVKVKMTTYQGNATNTVAELGPVEEEPSLI